MNHRKYPLTVAALLALMSLSALTGCATANTTAPHATLPAFKNEQEIRDLFKGWHDEQQRRVELQRKQRLEARALMREQSGMGALSSVLPPPAPAAKAAAPAAAGEADSVTNVQHAGVDEGGNVYVWTTAWRRQPSGTTVNSAVLRIPLDGMAPSALKTAGSPIDQFSFLEGDDGH